MAEARSVAGGPVRMANASGDPGLGAQAVDHQQGGVRLIPEGLVVDVHGAVVSVRHFVLLPVSAL
jgi:hypothetical protein